MTTAIPSLSTQGWVNTIEEKGDLALSYFITTEYSQSMLYAGQLASLPYLVKRYGTDPLALQSEVTSVLDRMIRSYFGETVTVVVNVFEADPEKPGQLTIQFRCIIRENGLEYNLGRRVEFLDSKLSNIVNINNG